MKISSSKTIDDIIPKKKLKSKEEKTMNNEKKSSKMSRSTKSGNIKKTKNKKKKMSRRKKLSIFFITILVLAMIAISIIGMIIFQNKKNVNTEVNASTFYTAKGATAVYDKDDKYIASLSLNNIRWTDIVDEKGEVLVSQDYLEGLIATEDKNFESHNGVDYPGMVKATISTLFTDNRRGGSSITMQTAKLVYMADWTKYDSETGIDRRSEDPIGYKVTQMLYAHEVEKNFSKEEILENYVNVVCFGSAGCGIKNASEYYYGKKPADLLLTGSATLAGMSQLPGIYNPYENPEGTKERRDIVLVRMLDEEYITQEEYEVAIAESIDATLIKNDNREIKNEDKYDGYLDVVYQEFLSLVDPNGDGQFDMDTAGMDIYTNMDSFAQETVYDVINSKDEKLFQDDVIQTGVSLQENGTGNILAIGNGRDDHGGFLGTNYAYNYQRQPGSAAKGVLSIAPAVEHLDWSSGHAVDDKEIFYDNGGPEVNNWNNKYLGVIPLRESIARSINTTALQSFKDATAAIGFGGMYDYAKSLGFKSIEKDTFNQSYAIGGWSKGTTPIEMAGAYATFGNKGEFIEPHTIDRISVQKSSPYFQEFGEEIKKEYASTKVVGEDTAFIMHDILDPSEKGALASEARVSGLDLGIKGGTSDWGDHGLQYGIPAVSQRDKWVVGFDANLTLATWTGYTQEYEKEGKYIALGSRYDMHTFKEIMTRLKEGKPELFSEKMVQPSNVVAKKASIKNDKLVEDAKGKTYYFISGSEDDKNLKSEIVDAPSNLTIKKNPESENVSLSWSYTADDLKGISWVVKVDGKEIKTIAKTSVVLTYDEIVKLSGCKSSYNITVSTKVDEMISKPTENYLIDFKSDDFCKENGTSNEEEINLREKTIVYVEERKGLKKKL